MAEIPAPASTRLKEPSRTSSKGCGCLVTGLGFIVALMFVAAIWDFFAPHENNITHGLRVVSSGKLRMISDALYQYSLDHHGEYPNGKSSTEVFQKLIDGHYVTDPALFYLCRGDGSVVKTEPTSNILEPKNVSFDVTVPVHADSPKGLPLVFVTGYKITYESGADAVFLDRYRLARTITIAAYVGDLHQSDFSIKSGRFPILYYRLEYRRAGSDVIGFVAHFIPVDFNPKGETFQQLTPDGPMEPQ